MKFKDVDQSAKHFAIILRIEARVNPKVIYGKDFDPIKDYESCFEYWKTHWLTKRIGLIDQYSVKASKGWETSFTLN